jgi:Cu-processing system permease protein
MRAIWIISQNTFREIMRDRILYGIVIFALLLIGLSLALGELSFAEQARISADFGFTGMQLGASILAIFLGSTLVSREVERNTILTLLARPITRTGFVVGKFFGLAQVVSTIVLGLGAVLVAVVWYLQLDINLTFAVALWGIFLEALILISLALFFGSFARPIMTVIFTTSFFLIGHWLNSLKFFADKSTSESFKLIGKAIVAALPNLEALNWRSAPIYNAAVPPLEIARSTGYAVAWIVFLLTLTSLIFRRRDFV